MNLSVHLKTFKMKLFFLGAFIMFLSYSAIAQSGSGSSNQTVPELVFQNPVLVAGTSGQDGAVYKFSNVATGIDAQVKIIRRSHSSVSLTSIDVPNMGWNKAFQPQLGIGGNVSPNQNWWIEFQMSFYQAGTNNKKKINKFYVTSLDVDGDGVSIKEYVQMEKIQSASFCPVTYLTEATPFTSNICPSGSIPCGECFTASPLVQCSNCSGTGSNGSSRCGNCKGSGRLHDQCDHAWEDGAPLTGDNNNGINKLIQAPVNNFLNIDTAGTQVMSTYIYEKKEIIRFKIGATSGTVASNAGERLNSLWFKQFSLAPPATLPVKMTGFQAMLENKNVKLNWTTAAEENFSHYVVERSTDGKTYSEIATVFANGNTSQASVYGFKDNNVSSATGILYYRLRLVEMSKEASYSEVKVIRLAKDKGALELIVFPNPAKDVVKVTMPNTWQNKKVIVEIYNANGIRIRYTELSNTSQTETVRLGDLSKGFYVVKATSEGRTLEQRIIKY
jgi:hypothetical protein